MNTRCPAGASHSLGCLVFVTGSCETSSRVTAYEECLQHAVFLVVDLVRAVEAVIASQSFHRRRRREHAIRLTRRLHARSDVDGIAPDVVGEPARADDPCHYRSRMQAHPDRKRGRQPRPQSPGGSNHVESEFRRHPGVIGAWRGYAGDRHVVVADRLYLFDPDIFSKLVEFAEQLIEAGDDFIGVLETTSMDLNAANFEAFRQSLRELGYIEEQNLIIEYRSAEGRGERFADL